MKVKFFDDAIQDPQAVRVKKWCFEHWSKVSVEEGKENSDEERRDHVEEWMMEFLVWDYEVI